MEKLYKKIGWKNKPNLSTPLGATNLKKIDEALDGLDNRTIELNSKDAEHSRHIEGLYVETRKNAQAIESSLDALKIIPTASGNTAYMDDASNMGLERIDLYGESKQNGTPTPTSPIPIESKIVEKVIVSGKNFFGFGESAIDKTTELRPLVSQRLIFTKIDDNTIKCNYNGGNYSSGFVELDGIDGTKDYAFSFIVEHNTFGFTPRIEKYASRCTSTRLSLLIYAANGATEVASSEYIILKNIQVEEGTTATEFEPYKPIQTVNLSAPIELNGIGGVRDTDKLKKFGVVVLDGSQTMILNSGSATGTSGSRRFQITCLSGKPSANTSDQVKANALCDQAIISTGSRTYTAQNEDNIFSVETSFVCLRLSGIATLEDMKAKLQANPITVVYELANPIETSLPQADIDAIKNLHTYKPNTVVMNDADAEMDVHYVADAKTYIDKKFKELATAIVNQ